MADQTVWTKTVDTVELEDAGDILDPLKRVLNMYLYTASRHEANGHPERAEYYHQQAENIGRLIIQ
jgi:hypothetical protein